MKLNKENKIQLRTKIEEQLENVPDGERIQLEKNLLEELLFETRVVEFRGGEIKKVSVKYLVWSGPFLSKIDLSDISFDDVLWDVKRYSPDGYEKLYGFQNLYEEYGITCIDLSNTNAKIDFSRAFGSDLDDVDLNISYCNFSNTDLSNNFINYSFDAEYCDFSNTNLRFNYKIKDASIGFNNSILSDIDFSEYTVDETFFTEGDADVWAYNSNLSNTGLNIKISSNISNIPNDVWIKYKEHESLMDEYFRLDSEPHDYDDSKHITKLKQISNKVDPLESEISEYRFFLDCLTLLGETIAKGYLVGCYVNGKKIKNKEEARIVASEKLKEYRSFKNELFSSVESNIKEQIGRMNK